MIRIHQVLATLGYGDAIGHEVLGIQRVLRAAGYESEIFVEAADHRLESMTRDYRELIDFSHPDNLLLHHFSLASKASRTAFALPDRMALIYHNITPPEFFVGLHRSLSSECFRGRRELARLRRTVRSRARRFRVQPPGSRGARVQEDRRPAGRAGFLASRRGRRIARSPTCSTTPGPTSCSSAVWCRTRRSKTSSASFTRITRSTTRDRGCSWSARRAGSSATWRRFTSSTATLGNTPCPFRRAGLERGTGGVLRDRRSLPVRERARRLLRAARRGVLQADSGAGLRRHGRAGDDGRRRRAV